MSTAKLSQQARQGALLAAFEQGENAVVYGPALRGLLNDVCYRRQMDARKAQRR